MADITLQQGEGKPLQLTYTNSVTKKATDLTGASVSFIVRAMPGGTVVIKKSDDDFNKGLASDGIITFTLQTDETNITPGVYYAQARAHLSSANSDLSDKFTIKIEGSLFDLTYVACLLDGKVTITS